MPELLGFLKLLFLGAGEADERVPAAVFAPWVKELVALLALDGGRSVPDRVDEVRDIDGG